MQIKVPFGVLIYYIFTLVSLILVNAFDTTLYLYDNVIQAIYSASTFTIYYLYFDVILEKKITRNIIATCCYILSIAFIINRIWDLHRVITYLQYANWLFNLSASTIALVSFNNAFNTSRYKKRLKDILDDYNNNLKSIVDTNRNKNKKFENNTIKEDATAKKETQEYSEDKRNEGSEKISDKNAIPSLKDTTEKGVVAVSNVTNDLTINVALENIKDRIKRKSAASAITLGVIFLIVIFGAFFSIGSLYLNEYRNIREIQGAKKDLIDRLSSIQKKYINDVSDSVVVIGHSSKQYVNVDSFRETIERETKEQNYFKEIARIEKAIQDHVYDPISSQSIDKKLDQIKQDKLQWDEIVMRISLATLTVFLVQIFFSVYKYFQAQTNYLENKLEALTLYLSADGESEKKELRRSLLMKVGSSPGFGKDPSSPIEQVLKMADRLNERTKK